MTLYNPSEAKMRKIEITPVPDGESLQWRCPRCRIQNELLKSEIGENKLYPCSNNCGYEFAIGYIPDDMRHWLKESGNRNIDKRPRITRF